LATTNAIPVNKFKKKKKKEKKSILVAARAWKNPNERFPLAYFSAVPLAIVVLEKVSFRVKKCQKVESLNE